MYFNQAPPRTRHHAQCQSDAASSALTSVVDGRVKYKEQHHRILGVCFKRIFFLSPQKGYKWCNCLTHSDHGPGRGRNILLDPKTVKRRRGTRAWHRASEKTLIRLIRRDSKMISRGGERKKRGGDKWRGWAYGCEKAEEVKGKTVVCEKGWAGLKERGGQWWKEASPVTWNIFNRGCHILFLSPLSLFHLPLSHSETHRSVLISFKVG